MASVICVALVSGERTETEAGAKPEAQVFIYTHKSFEIGYNNEQVIMVNLTAENPRPLTPGRGFIENKHSTDAQGLNPMECLEVPPPPPCACMSIPTHGGQSGSLVPPHTR